MCTHEADNLCKHGGIEQVRVKSNRRTRGRREKRDSPSSTLARGCFYSSIAIWSMAQKKTHFVASRLHRWGDYTPNKAVVKILSVHFYLIYSSRSPVIISPV